MKSVHSQVVGACWYMLGVERLDKCWSGVCTLNESATFGCTREFLDCASLTNTAIGAARQNWLNTTEGTSCNSTNFNYGIYVNAINNNIASAGFLTRYLYSLWLGLLALRYSFCSSLRYSTCDVAICLASLVFFFLNF